MTMFALFEAGGQVELPTPKPHVSAPPHVGLTVWHLFEVLFTSRGLTMCHLSEVRRPIPASCKQCNLSLPWMGEG